VPVWVVCPLGVLFEDALLDAVDGLPDPPVCLGVLDVLFSCVGESEEVVEVVSADGLEVLEAVGRVGDGETSGEVA